MKEMDVDERIARISDILEQIHELNKLLKLFKEQDGDESSIRQYQFMRGEFVRELKQIMKGFDLQVEALGKAA
jgi:hypothetical protein